MLLLGSIRSITIICIRIDNVFSKTYPSFLTFKEGSTFLSKPLFPQGRENVTAPSRRSAPLRSKVGGPSKVYAKLCGLGPPGVGGILKGRMYLNCLRTLLPKDEDGNAKVGKDIRLYECKNCVDHAADESKVVVQGLNGYIVADKHGQLLVCSLKEEQRIKEFGK